MATKMPMTDMMDDAYDKKKGIPENSKRDTALDKKRGLPAAKKSAKKAPPFKKK